MRALVALVRWGTLVGTLLGTLSGQSLSADDLRSHNWHLRNASAIALAKDPAADLAGVVNVLQTAWDDDIPVFEIGGKGGERSQGLRQETLAAARAEYSGISRSPFELWILRPESAEQLIVPLHPHALAIWVLMAHPERAEECARLLEAAGLQLPHVALAWFGTKRPGDAELLRLIEDPERGPGLAAGMSRAVPSGVETLRRLLPQALPRARGVILAVGHPDLVRGEAAVGACVEQLLSALSEREVRQAGALLVSAADGTTARLLAAHLGTDPLTNRRCLGVLCLLGAAAEPAGEQILQLLDDPDRISRHRALVTLASFELPVAMRAQAAKALFSLFESHRDHATRLLALDALAMQGEEVTEAMQAILRAKVSAVSRREGELAAPALACLQQLGKHAGVTTARKFEIASGAERAFFSMHTWLAVANDGAAGAELLAPILRHEHSVMGQEAAEQCAKLLADTAPESLLGWLRSGSGEVRRLAVIGLRKLGKPSSFSTRSIGSLLADVDPRVQSLALLWLAERPDADVCQEAVFACLRANPYLDAGYDLVATLDASAETKIAQLEPVLRMGMGWAAVRNLAPEVQHAACKRWLAETSDVRVRDLLLAQLVRFGLGDEAELEQVRVAIQGGACVAILSALAKGQELPPSLREDLVQWIDRDYARRGFQAVCSDAVNALWAHPVATGSK